MQLPTDPIQRGKLAQEILDNPLWTNTFEQMQQVYVGILKNLLAKDDLGRFRYTEALKQVEFVKEHLEMIMNDGALTEQQAQLTEPPKPFIRRVF